MRQYIFDILFAAICLVSLSPVFVILGILIKLESRGPVFFKHLRVGQNGKPFLMYKFRKMHHGKQIGPRISPKYDYRLTRVGRVMERLKLDEIPQFINILRGDMSLLGPRPEIPEIVKLYNPQQRAVLSVKPGLIGPSQILWRNEKNMFPDDVPDIEAYYIEKILPQKLACDLQYIAEANFAKNFKYLLQGIFITLGEPFHLIHFKRRIPELIRLAAQVFVCGTAFYSALLLKNDFQISLDTIGVTLPVFLIFMIWLIPALVFFGVHSTVWKYFSSIELLVIAKSIAFATGMAMMTMVLLPGNRMIFSLLLLNAILAIAFSGAVRVLAALQLNKIQPEKKKILVYGANDEGELLLRRLRANLGINAKPVGFLDADPQKRGKVIHDLKIMGDAHDLSLLKELYGIEEVLIAGQHNGASDIPGLLNCCKELNIDYHFVSTTLTD